MIVIDFETFSEADLKKSGAWVYAEDPSTDIICMSWSIDDMDKPDLWTPGEPFPKKLRAAIEAGAPVEAHNVLFEMCIWNAVGVPRYGFPTVAEEQWRCTMAAAAFRALPLALEKAAGVLKLPVQKDMVGNKAMKRITKPDKNGNRLSEAEHFELYDATYAYCLDDNLAERHLSRVCGQIPAYEMPVFHADMRLQRRGLRIDQELCRAAVDIRTRYVEAQVQALPELTQGRVTTPNQVARIREWLADAGCHLDNLQADTIEPVVETLDPGDPVRRVLEARLNARSRQDKYAAALRSCASDGRVHGSTQYYGATTGRNVGRLFQPLNLRRPRFYGDMHLLADAIKTRSIDFVEMVGGAPCMEILADAVRGIIIPEEGRELIAGDYSAIEAVVTAGLANETEKLEVFRRGEDPYCWFASKVVGREVQPKKIYGKPNPLFTEQDALDRQKIGKPGELSCGFSGGVGAWRKFDNTNTFTDEEVDKIKTTWRKAHPRIAEMWKALEHCAISAVLNPGDVKTYRAPDALATLKYQYRQPYLLLELPSGRRLHYYRPSVQEALMPWTDRNGDPVYKPVVMYWTTREGRWQKAKAWRGLLTENAVQAVARDLMVAGWLNVEKAGYDPILTSYDEVLCEVDKGRGDVGEYEELMCKFNAPYAEDWPVRCEAWLDSRYKKA